MLKAYLDALEMILSLSLCLTSSFHKRRELVYKKLQVGQKFSFEVLAGLARALLPGTPFAFAGRQNISPTD